MKISSTIRRKVSEDDASSRQQELDFESSGSATEDATSSVAEAEGFSTFAASATSELPRLGALSETYALTSRIAGRLNAANISEEEHQALLRERQMLLDKKLHGEITRQESNRLEYVRWSLDRIEDAKHGQALDVLEGYVARYEQFLSDVRLFQANLQRALQTRK